MALTKKPFQVRCEKQSGFQSYSLKLHTCRLLLPPTGGRRKCGSAATVSRGAGPTVAKPTDATVPQLYQFAFNPPIEPIRFDSYCSKRDSPAAISFPMKSITLAYDSDSGARF